MRLSTFSAPLSALLLAFAMAFAPLTSQAVTLNVNCDQPNSKLPTITSALKLLNGISGAGAHTINVTGTCNENISIKGYDQLTINGFAAAVADASGGKHQVVDVYASRNVVFTNFKITGSGPTAEGISCRYSLCELDAVTVQNASFGVAAYNNASIILSGGVLQQNNWGLGVIGGGEALAFNGAVMQNNASGGVLLLAHGTLSTGSGSADAPVVEIRNNSGTGITMLTNSSLHCAPCSVTDNGGVGVLILEGASAYFNGLFGPYTITGNGFNGVYLTELASANFTPSGTVTGNGGGMDVNCGPQFTTARGATMNIGGGATNCVEPQP